MEIRELRSFIRVARAGSLSRAAAELYVAQPALSRQIAKLEAEIGVPLFVRHGRGVRMTAAGARLLERAEMITHLLNETAEEVRASADEERGHLAVGLPPTMSALIGAELTREFRTQWPNVSLHVREGLSTSLQEWVMDRRVDLAVVYNQPPLEAFQIQPLYSEPMMLIGPPGDGGGSRSYHIRDLANTPLILPGMPHSNRLLVEQAAAQHGVRLRVALEVDSVALTKQLVKSGEGYSILAYIAVQQEIASGELIAHRIERPSIRSSVAVTTLRDTSASRFALAWIDLLQQHLKRFLALAPWGAEVQWMGAPLEK